MAAFPEDDVLEVESAFGMAKPITPYRFQPTFADYQQRRRSQKDHPGARSKSSNRESSDTVTEVGGALNDTFPQPASAAPSCCSTDHEETRVGHTRWCSCGHCVAMTRKEDCSCCSEYPAIVNMRGSVKCVTEHYGFREVCLSRHVLLTAMAAYREFRCLPQQPLSNRYDKLVASAFLFVTMLPVGQITFSTAADPKLFVEIEFTFVQVFPAGVIWTVYLVGARLPWKAPPD